MVRFLYPFDPLCGAAEDQEIEQAQLVAFTELI
jgi:hypothetical protein